MLRLIFEAILGLAFVIHGFLGVVFVLELVMRAALFGLPLEWLLRGGDLILQFFRIIEDFLLLGVDVAVRTLVHLAGGLLLFGLFDLLLLLLEAYVKKRQKRVS